MGLFDKLFRSGDGLAALRQAVRQERWADVRRLGEGLDLGKLPDEAAAEWRATLELAGDRLAEINLAEGEDCLRIHNLPRAREHFQLAASHACDPNLRARADELLARHGGRPGGTIRAEPVATSCCAAGCAAAPEAVETAMDEGDELDLETRMELVLSSYPEDWRERYLHAAPAFKKALLLAHEGFDDAALAAFDALARDACDELFLFERGALLARMGDSVRGRQDLERAVARHDRHVLALELLVRLDLAEGRVEQAEGRLQGMLAADLASAFCLVHLALIAAQRGDEPAALAHGERALQSGALDVESLLLLSALFEKAGRLDQAERLLTSLPTGGCGGSAHPLLAEFWLRHGRSLEKALESFKAAGRQEPENPRWAVRVAQVYARLGWLREGRELLENVLSTSDIDGTLRQEAEEILAFCGK